MGRAYTPAMTLRLIDGLTLRSSLSMRAAVDALERGLIDHPTPSGPVRSSVPAGSGEMLLMPATGAQTSGVKVIGLQPENPARGLPFVQGVYVLFDTATLSPRALIDAAELTRIRTASISALGARYLARPDSSTMVVFGTGVQAEAHVESMRAVLPITRVTIVGRRPEAAAALAVQLAADGLEIAAGAAEDVRDADVVCTCTSTAEALFEDGWIRAGTHIAAIGSYLPARREVPAATVARARVAVDDVEAALAEAGDLLRAIDEGAFAAERILTDLPGLVRGASVRTSVEDVTLFKAVGSAFEDLIVASAVA